MNALTGFRTIGVITKVCVSSLVFLLLYASVMV